VARSVSILPGGTQLINRGWQLGTCARRGLRRVYSATKPRDCTASSQDEEVLLATADCPAIGRSDLQMLEIVRRFSDPRVRPSTTS